MENKTLYKKFNHLKQNKLNEIFVNSCLRGNIKVVKYLLTNHGLNYDK